MSRDGAASVGSGPGEPQEHHDDDNGAFGDSGRFGDVSGARREIHWPTVLVAGAVAAVVSSLILTLGVVGFHRSADHPAEIVVAVDPRGAVSVDGTAVVDGHTSPSATSPAAPAPDTSTPQDGGGLSPATGVPSTPAPADADRSPTDDAAAGADSTLGPRPGSEPAAPTQDAAAPSQEAAAQDGPVTGWTPPAPLPSDFAVTTAEPTLDDLNAIVHLLVATPADDAAKARNLEAGMGGVVVPQTVYNLGVFRAPQGWKRITGPVERNGRHITATLHSESAGRPSITTRVVFVLDDGNWKLSTRSVCEGVRTVGLPLSCGG